MRLQVQFGIREGTYLTPNERHIHSRGACINLEDVICPKLSGGHVASLYMPSVSINDSYLVYALVHT